jgi:hypothetical protein
LGQPRSELYGNIIDQNKKEDQGARLRRYTDVERFNNSPNNPLNAGNSILSYFVSDIIKHAQEDERAAQEKKKEA